MSGVAVRESFRDFGAFYREYAQTEIHAISAAALTLFGLLTFIHPGFVVVAISAYVLPPVYVYLTTREDSDTNRETRETPFKDSNTESETHSSSDTDTEIGWVEIDTPTDEPLYDVAISNNGPYAVGADGTVLARRSGDWEQVLKEGPMVQSNDLRGVDISSDGRNVWFAGDSGVLAQYDTEVDRLTDYSAPEDNTSNWEDIAVTGSAGKESIYLVTGSGEVLRGVTVEGNIQWGNTVKPGSGSSMTSVEFTDTECGYLCDTNETVYETTNAGESYEVIGIDDANCSFTDIAAPSPERVIVSGDDGTMLRYDGESNWTKLSVGDHAITAIDTRNDDGLASGEQGTIYERTSSGWEGETTLINSTLHGIALGKDTPDVAVGDSGTVIHKPE
jgi:photosystem II stability/assembly factor-like uncharacterized protein